MITVYAIHDTNINEIYVGMTNNLERRLAEHKRGQNKYTRKFNNFVLVLKEEYPDYKKGRSREKYLKSGCGKEFIKSSMAAGVV